MAVDTYIKDGRGKSNATHVTPEGAICVQSVDMPPMSPEGMLVVFRQFLTTDGTSSGTSDMQVSSDTDFYVGSDQTFDIYIKTLSFVISDGSASLNQFGNITALSNGCQLIYQSNMGDVTIHEALKSNFDFIRLCQGNPAFGDAAGSFRANNVSGNSEGYIPVLDFERVFGMSYGLRIRAGSTDKITLKVRDTTTGVDEFNCIAYGFTRRTLASDD